MIDALRKADGPQTLKEVAAAAGLPASNCHRYLVSFVRVGYVAQDPVSGRYDLGPQVLRAGLKALGRLDAVAAGTQALTRLVDFTGYTGQLAIWADPGVVIVRWLPGRLAVRTSLAMGSTLPLLRSATGRVFLAFLAPRRTARQVEAELGTSNDSLDPVALAAEVRKAGYAQVSGVTIPGLSAACAPLLDSNGEAAATLTLVGLSDGIEASAVAALRSHAREASLILGWSGSA